MKYIFGSFTLIALIMACSPKTSTEVVTEMEEVSMTAEMSSGKSIYESRCIKCHGYKEIKNYSRAQWEKILPAMMEKAQLAEEEKKQVHAYVFGTINE